ncbi:MAG: type II toxin-antitoxin system HicB family antitoxin [Ktedonobacterales bacterium]
MTTDRLPHRASDYAIRIIQEPTTDGGVVYGAWYEDLPGCESQGDTVEEARANLQDAYALYMSDLLERGLPIPSPAPKASQAREIVSYTITTRSSQTHDALTYGASIDTEAPDVPLSMSIRS